MKKLYTILLVTFMGVNLFGQSGYKLDPGKLNIWRNFTLPAPDYSYPYTTYSGIENLVNVNYNSYASYSYPIGIKNTVTASNGGGSSGAIGISSSATAQYYPKGVIGSATGYGSTGIKGDAYPTNSTENGYYTGVDGNASADGTSASNYGVSGYAFGTGSSSLNYGVFGSAGSSYGNSGTSTNYGVYGKTSNTNSTSFAGYFQGKVHVNGTLSKSAGTFKIDHPLDPLNKYLSHSFVESPDMMNIYNGNITTDQNGKATVTLPAYFEALNMDFRYQLTTIGSPAQAYIFEEVKGNKFIIATDKPTIKVSWQVTGIRNDAYAKQNRVVPEQDKPDAEKGKYLNADAFGLPREESIHAIKNQEPKKD